jgi:hypothetical protein
LELEVLIFNLWSCEGGERWLNRFEDMHGQRTDAENRPLSKGGERDFGSHLHPKVYAASARDFPRMRRDNIIYMFACNTPST